MCVRMNPIKRMSNFSIGLIYKVVRIANDSLPSYTNEP